MVTKNLCAKCGGSMTEGFIIDHAVKQQQIWFEGQPESSFWSGIKTSGRDAYNVQAYCCADCNFLEFYTAEKTDLGGIFN
jgi:ribosomal protein L37E